MKTSMYEQMKDFDKKSRINFNLDGDTIYEILGYDNPQTMLKDSFENKTVGAFVALDRVMAEIGAKNMFFPIFMIQMLKGSECERGIADVLFYLYERFTEDEIVELVGRTIQARMVYEGKDI